MSSGSCPVCQGTSPTCPIAADWADEERMAFLTSHVAASEQEALSNHQSHAREEMLEFWSKAVGHAFQESTSADLSLDLEVLAKDTLAWHDVVAPGLELAIGNMISSGELMFRGDLEVCSTVTVDIFSTLWQGSPWTAWTEYECRIPKHPHPFLESRCSC